MLQDRRRQRVSVNAGALVIGLATLVLSLATATGLAVAGDPSPILTLDTGGHMAVVRDIQFSPDGKSIVSASDDKAVRIWSLASGKTERVIRGEVGEADNGKAMALALSPDGDSLAVAGFFEGTTTGASVIRIYDFGSGDLKAILQGHTDGVLSLAYSQDGRLLASGSMDDTAIIWSMDDFQSRRRLKGHDGDVNGIRFDADGGRVLTASDDGTVGIWQVATGEPVVRVPGHQGVVFDVAVSGAFDRAFSAGYDRTIRSFDPETGSEPRGFVRLPTAVYALAISPNGKLLIAGEGGSPFHTRLINTSSGKETVDYAGHDGPLTAVAFSPDGRLAASAGGANNEIHVFEVASGRLVQRLRGEGRSVWSVGIDDTGRHIGWGNSKLSRDVNAYGPLDTELRLPIAGEGLSEPRKLVKSGAALREARIRIGKRALQHRRDPVTRRSAFFDLIEGSKPLSTIVFDENNGYSLDSYSFTANGQEIIAGASRGVLASYSIDGRKLKDFVGHSSDVWSIAASADGKLIVSGSDDQTVRLWNAETAENIVSLLVTQSGEWVMWTPQGYYAASPGGDKAVGWHLNSGFAKSARFVSAAQLKRHFYRPEIVRDAIIARSAKAAIEQAAIETFDLEELIRRQPPRLRFADVAAGAVVSASPYRMTIEIEATNDPVEEIELTVNGRLVSTTAFDDGETGRRSVSFDVPLSRGDNRIEVAASNAVGRTRESLSVTLDGSGSLDQRGTLYVIAVGVDDYPALGQDLQYAGVDAKALAKKLVESSGPLHQKVETLVLAKDADGLPTADNILKAFRLLEKAEANDTVVLFLAGHGINDGADYLFLPTNAALSGERWQKDTVIKWQTLQRLLEITRGRRIMLVDTCHSGNAYNARLIKDAADASIVIYTATDADTLALEKPELAHGVFTYSVLAGLNGRADVGDDRSVSVLELSSFLDRAVRDLTGGRQAPVFYSSQSTDFVIGRH